MFDLRGQRQGNGWIGRLAAKYRDKPAALAGILLLGALALMSLGIVGAGALIWNLAPDETARAPQGADFPLPDTWKGPKARGPDSSFLAFRKGDGETQASALDPEADLSKIEKPSVLEAAPESDAPSDGGGETPGEERDGPAGVGGGRAGQGLRATRWETGGGRIGGAPGGTGGSGAQLASGSALSARAPGQAAGAAPNSPLSLAAWKRKIASILRAANTSAGGSASRRQGLAGRLPAGTFGSPGSGGALPPAFSSEGFLSRGASGPTGATAGGSPAGISGGTVPPGGGGLTTSGGSAGGSSGGTVSTSGGSVPGGSSGGTRSTSGESAPREPVRDLKALRGALAELRDSIATNSIAPARQAFGQMLVDAEGKLKSAQKATEELRDANHASLLYFRSRGSFSYKDEGIELLDELFKAVAGAHDSILLSFIINQLSIDDSHACLDVKDPRDLLSCFNRNLGPALVSGPRFRRKEVAGLQEHFPPKSEAYFRKLEDRYKDKAPYHILVAPWKPDTATCRRVTKLGVLGMGMTSPRRHAGGEALVNICEFNRFAGPRITAAFNNVNQALDMGRYFNHSTFLSGATTQRTFLQNRIIAPYGGQTRSMPVLFGGIDAALNGLEEARENYTSGSGTGSLPDECPEREENILQGGGTGRCKNDKVKFAVRGVRGHLRALAGLNEAINDLDTLIAKEEKKPLPGPIPGRPDPECIPGGLSCSYQDDQCGWGGGFDKCRECCNGRGRQGRSLSIKCPNYSTNDPRIRGARPQIVVGYCAP